MTIGSRLYSILFSVWHWEEATRFYNEHTLAVGVKIRELKEERTALTKDREKAWAEINKLVEQDTEHVNLLNAQLARNTELEDENEAQAKTIVELKAKLYDLMTAGA